MTAIAPVRHNRLFTEPAAQPFRNEIAPIVFNLLSDGSRSQTHRGVPPVDDQLMNVLTVGGQEQEVPPLVVADVQTSVLIHPLQQLLRLHPVQRDPQVAESPDQLLQVDLSVFVPVQVGEVQAEILLVFPDVVDEVGQGQVAALRLGTFQEFLEKDGRL
jgi:hypothetical protein